MTQLSKAELKPDSDHRLNCNFINKPAAGKKMPLIDMNGIEAE
ncbi:hypothetical protein [Shewanella indica]|nr:hypothetical protein [Shewanella indica]